MNGNDSVNLRGVIEFKPISQQDNKMELIPENYIESPIIDNSAITLEMKKVFSEITFQGIKRALTNENI